MTKVIACGELRYYSLDELKALLRTLQIELRLTAFGSPGRAIVLARIESVPPRHGARLTRHPKPSAL